MILTEKHNINKGDSLYNEVDNLCFLSKNLYNKANYIIRQEFINTSKETGKGNYLNYNAINKIMIKTKDVDYYALPPKVSNQTLMQLHQNWLSFFASIKDWSINKHKYKGRPSLPQYLDKQKGRFVVKYDIQAISKKSLKEGTIKLSKTNIEIPFINQKEGNTLKQVRIVPMSNNAHKIEIIYEKQEQNLNLNPNNLLAIDIGIDNLMTLTSNKQGFIPLIVNGRILKSANQFYNKQKAKMQGELPKNIFTSSGIKKLTNKRNCIVDNELHQWSNFIIKLCIKHDIGKIVIGNNKGWKNEINLGDKNNQNFVGIPFAELIKKIQYKAQMVGIDVVVREEAYTSKASFLDLDEIPLDYKAGADYEFSGKRIKRGLYKSKNGLLINADVNGSYNILRKELLNIGQPLNSIEGFAVNPIRIKSVKHFYKFL